MASLVLALAFACGPGALWAQEAKTAAKEPQMCDQYRRAFQTPKELASELECRINWLREARAYTLAGGKGTTYTNDKSFEMNKKRAQELATQLSGWAAEVKMNAVSTKYEDEHGGKAKKAVNVIDGSKKTSDYDDGAP